MLLNKKWAAFTRRQNANLNTNLGLKAKAIAARSLLKKPMETDSTTLNALYKRIEMSAVDRKSSSRRLQINSPEIIQRTSDLKNSFDLYLLDYHIGYGISLTL